MTTTPEPSAEDIAEKKKTLFDREVRLLIQQADETLRVRFGTSIELGKIPDELSSLTRYFGIYSKMSPDEHYQYFESVFNQKRREILNTLKDDRWLRTGRIRIQFGQGNKKVEEKKIMIMLSDIFLVACEIQEQAEKSLEGIAEEHASGAAGKDIIRPNILLLHLMRIFYHLNDGPDKKAVGDIVTQLETDLGVKNKTVGASSAPPPATQGVTGGGLGGLFNIATNMMSKMGFQPPANMTPPSEGEISNVIETVFNNPTTQNAIQGMFSSLQNCTNFGDAVNTVVQNVTDPQTMEAIQGSVANTANFAQMQAQQQAQQQQNQTPSGPQFQPPGPQFQPPGPQFQPPAPQGQPSGPQFQPPAPQGQPQGQPPAQ